MKLAENINNKIVQIAELAGHHSFYLYDPSVMHRKITHLKDILPESVKIYYAMKANPHDAFLKTAKAAGAQGIEIGSMGEGKMALAAGFTPDQLIFTGPGKSTDELEWSVKRQLNTVHVESLTEAHRLNQICERLGKRQDILVRVNPNFYIHDAQARFSGDSSKMGIDQNRFMDVLPEIYDLSNLNFKGLHVYAASGVLKLVDLLENCQRVFTLAREVEARYDHIRCDIIDFGGGFGIDYLETGQDFSPKEYNDGLRKLIEGFGFSDRTFVLELGRYLTADSGWYCAEIIDIKESLGKKQVVCGGGNSHFRRPVALGINHPLMIVEMNKPNVFEGQESVHDEMVFVGGPLCNTADKLAPKDIYVAKAEIGDIAVFGYAGAYGLTMSHFEFLGHNRPPEIVI